MNADPRLISYGNVVTSAVIVLVLCGAFVFHMIVMFNGELCCNPAIVGCLATCYARDSVVLSVSLLICALVMVMLLATCWIYFLRYKVRTNIHQAGDYGKSLKKEHELQGMHFQYVTQPINTATHFIGVIVNSIIVIFISILISVVGFSALITDTANTVMLTYAYLFVLIFEVLILYTSLKNIFMFL